MFAPKLNGFSIYVKETHKTLAAQGQYTRLPILYSTLQPIWQSLTESTRRPYERKTRRTGRGEILLSESIEFALAELEAANNCKTSKDGQLCSNCEKFRVSVHDKMLGSGYW